MCYEVPNVDIKDLHLQSLMRWKFLTPSTNHSQKAIISLSNLSKEKYNDAEARDTLNVLWRRYNLRNKRIKG